MQKHLTFLDTIIYSCLPFILTFVFSFFTLLTLVRRRKNFVFKRNETNTASSTSQTRHSSSSFKSSDIKKRHCHLSKLKLTLMLMTFPLSYLVTTCPVFVIITLKLLENYFAHFETNFESELVIAKTLMYANNSFNVLLFILTGKTLRNDVIKLFRFKRVSKTRIVETPNGDFNLIENNNKSKKLLPETNGVDFV